MGKNIAVLASGSGTNAENIIRYFREKGSACVALVLTNRQNAFVLERAKGLGVPCVWFAKSDWESGELVLSTLREHDIDFVVLAGFLARVPDNILHAYPNKNDKYTSFVAAQVRWKGNVRRPCARGSDCFRRKGKRYYHPLYE